MKRLLFLGILLAALVLPQGAAAEWDPMDAGILSGDQLSIQSAPPDIQAGAQGSIPRTYTTYSWTGSGQPGSTFECSFNNSAWSACTSPKTYSGLSNNNVNWENRDVSESKSGIAFGDGKFVTVGGAGVIRTSIDGENWSPQNSGTTSILRSVTWSGVQFVAVGDSGVIITSPDGITWDTRNSGTTTTLTGIAANSSQLVATGYSGAILTSSDNGASWTARTSGTSNRMQAVTWNGTQFVAVGDSGVIITSPDGITWTARVSNVANHLYSVTWSGSQLVAAGGMGNVTTSPDGITWTAQNSGTSNPISSVVWANGKFVATATNSIITSSNGVSWTQSYDSGFESLAAVEWGNSKFIAISSSSPFTAISADGINWTTSGNVPDYSYGLTGVAGNASEIVTVGGAGLIRTSLDSGATWAKKNSGTAETLRDVIWNNSMFVAVGNSGTILTSPDGATWTARTSGTGNILTGSAWNGTRFVTVGNSGTILTSPDGINWTSRTSGTTNNLNSVSWGGALFVAAGNSGTILTSPDGINWTSRTSGVAASDLNGVASSGNQFVIAGEEVLIPSRSLLTLVSTDGISWTAQRYGTKGLSAGFSDVSWTGSSYVAVGTSGTIRIGQEVNVFRVREVFSSELTSPEASRSFSLTSSPPFENTPPVVSGDPRVGQTLQTTDGTWNGVPAPTFTYQWQSCQFSAGENCSDISGATTSSYVLQSGDAGRFIRVRVTATNSEGTANAVSERTGIYQAPVVVKPSVSGTPRVGSALTASASASAGFPAPTISYQWQVSDSGTSNWTNISGATNASFTPSTEQAGKYLRVQATATNSEGSDTKPSDATAVVVEAPVVVKPSVSGTPRVGSALTASASASAGYPNPTIDYQWQVSANGTDGWTNISGATNASFTPSTEQAGKYLRVQATATNSEGSDTKPSDATSAVAEAPVVTKPSISGTARVSSALTASASASAGFPAPDITYQWQVSINGTDGWANISGATNASFTPATEQAGKYLRVQATATNSEGSDTKASDATSAVGELPVVTKPSISGTARVGSPLLASAFVEAGVPAPSISYQWQISEDGRTGWRNIDGAGGASFTPSTEQAGRYLRVRATATNLEGVDSKESEATSMVTESPSNTSLPTISGEYRAGQALQASLGKWRGVPAPTFSFSWARCESSGGNDCVGIAGGETYVPTEEDVGKFLQVTVLAQNEVGRSSATSERAGPIQTNIMPTTRIYGNKKFWAKRGWAKVNFMLASSQAGSIFSCRLNRKPWTSWKKCSWNLWMRLRPGKYTLFVRATSRAGTATAPAQKKFRVLRKR